MTPTIKRMLLLLLAATTVGFVLASATHDSIVYGLVWLAATYVGAAIGCGLLLLVVRR